MKVNILQGPHPRPRAMQGKVLLEKELLGGFYCPKGFLIFGVFWQECGRWWMCFRSHFDRCINDKFVPIRMTITPGEDIFFLFCFYLRVLFSRFWYLCGAKDFSGWSATYLISGLQRDVFC